MVIHIFQADNSSLGTGSHDYERIREVRDRYGVELEVGTQCNAFAIPLAAHPLPHDW